MRTVSFVLGMLCLARGALALASDLEVPVRDGGADPGWPVAATVRYELIVGHGDAMKECYRQRSFGEKIRVEFEVGASRPGKVRLTEGRSGAFSRCIFKLIESLETRVDGGTVAVGLPFGDPYVTYNFEAANAAMIDGFGIGQSPTELIAHELGHVSAYLEEMSPGPGQDLRAVDFENAVRRGKKRPAHQPNACPSRRCK